MLLHSQLKPAASMASTKGPKPVLIPRPNGSSNKSRSKNGDVGASGTVAAGATSDCHLLP